MGRIICHNENNTGNVTGIVAGIFPERKAPT
jgi:hypothetical protein